MKLDGFVGEVVRSSLETGVYLDAFAVDEVPLWERRLDMACSFNKLAALASVLDEPDPTYGLQYPVGTRWFGEAEVIMPEGQAKVSARMLLQRLHDPERSSTGILQLGLVIPERSPAKQRIPLVRLDYTLRGGLQPKAINSRQPFLPGTQSWEELECMFDDAAVELAVRR